MKLVVATTSAHKLRELRELMSQLGLALEVVGRDAFPGAPDVVEDGKTFADNARLKAVALATFTGQPTLADDSGISVDALGGEPGVHSARWVEGSDEDRTRALVARLDGVPDGQRDAHYTCALCLALPGGPIVEVEGRCDGTIGRAFVGQGGFGYDPVFIGDDGRSFAQLTAAEKNARSHRSRALAQMAPHLRELARP
ncbi:MAG: RdgB/HAM1 family non-canonical purine NTP pyrophosphatase [Deltaproteobacteria bacterium]|nr:RdgB/HAM1 family non-canonical purine NTP pyrophosphatase [Deltaproteobacteria bacterium]